ncbi:MAG TPA: cytochrome c oxidase subunit II [Dehalococcoidia bacterium]|nr:cytochrome c oxidase subunit II [Dehalococcoidia bacterium]
MASRTRLLRRYLASASLLLTVIATTACWGTNPQDTLAPRGPVARDQKALFYPAFWIAVVVFFVVEGLLVYAVIRFRHRRGDPDDRLVKQVHGNTRIEIAWTIAPTLLLALLAIPTVATVYNLEPKRTADSIQVNVVGHQWWWEFQYTDYPDPNTPSKFVTTANELHVPVGRRVNITLKSVDVIHAFFVPSLAGQLDAVPGHNNQMWLQADHAGEYLGQCTQFCGSSHAFMRFRVIADDDFNGWLTSQQAPPVAPTAATQAGARLFATQTFSNPGHKAGACYGCHAINTVSQGNVGPNLTHFASRGTFAGASLDRTPENIARWLRDPQSVKPDAIMPNLGLSDQEIADLVAYLESLK